MNDAERARGGDSSTAANAGICENRFDCRRKADGEPFDTSDRSASVIVPSFVCESTAGRTITSDLPPSIIAAVSSRKSASRLRFSCSACLLVWYSVSSSSCREEDEAEPGVECSWLMSEKAREPRKTTSALSELLAVMSEDAIE